MEVEQNVEIENGVSSLEQQTLGNGDLDVVIVNLNDADNRVETINVNGEDDGEMEKDESLEVGAEREQVESIRDEEMEEADYIKDRAAVETDNEEDIENKICDAVDEEPVHVHEEPEEHVHVHKEPVHVQKDIVDGPVVDNKDTDDIVNKHIPNIDAIKEYGKNQEPNNNSIKTCISKFGSPAKKVCLKHVEIS